MSIGGSKGKSSTNYSDKQTSTPNNLPVLQNAWGDITDLNRGLSPMALPTIAGGIGNVNAGANAGTAGDVGGINAALMFANGGTANPANALLDPFANGSMDGRNPEFNDMVRRIGLAVQPQVDGDFAASGRYGSGANANAFASALTNKAGDLAYQNYGDSLARRLQAAGQISQNNTNATGQAVQAVSTLPWLAASATKPGETQVQAGLAPSNAIANQIGVLGAGGGTQTGSGQSTTKNSQSGFSFSPFGSGGMFNPISLFSSGGGLFG